MTVGLSATAESNCWGFVQCSDGVELLQLVKAPDANCSSLLITTRQGLVLLRGQDLTPLWKLSLQGLRRFAEFPSAWLLF